MRGLAHERRGLQLLHGVSLVLVRCVGTEAAKSCSRHGLTLASGMLLMSGVQWSLDFNATLAIAVARPHRVL